MTHVKVRKHDAIAVAFLAIVSASCGTGEQSNLSRQQPPASTTSTVTAPSSTTSTTIGKATMIVTLSAERVVPGPGDASLKGTLTLTVDPSSGEVCEKIKYGKATADSAPNAQSVSLQLARGAISQSGDPVLTDRIGPVFGGLVDREESFCLVRDSALTVDLIKNRAGYYVQVTTAAFPGGAIRGQLG